MQGSGWGSVLDTSSLRREGGAVELGEALAGES